MRNAGHAGGGGRPRVVRAAGVLGWTALGVAASPLPGPSGNVEFFVHFRRDVPEDPALDAEEMIMAVVQAVSP